jgi:hypothetical protein
MNRLKQLLKRAYHFSAVLPERLLLAQGKQLANDVARFDGIQQLDDVEFSIFSQFGDDGIIQYLVTHIPDISHTFIEFGVEDYSESNTRFLLMNNNWSGFVLDGSERNVAAIKRSPYYWRYDLTAHAAFITAENVNNLMAMRRFRDVGLLHIDIDGNDYWVWQALSNLRAEIVIMEFNSVLGCARPIAVPYDSTFDRVKAHFSGLYWGASISAMNHLAEKLGYKLIGSNGAGNNAYFVRADRLNSAIRAVAVERGYRESKFSDSRDDRGRLTHLRGAERLACIRGLPVVNVITGEAESI